MNSASLINTWPFSLPPVNHGSLPDSETYKGEMRSTDQRKAHILYYLGLIIFKHDWATQIILVLQIYMAYAHIPKHSLF